MKTLLIVDDQDLYLKSLDLALNRKFKIYLAKSFNEALSLMSNDIELALIDIRLDEDDSNNIDGLKLLEWLRMNMREVIPFVMSAYQQFSYAEQALNLGARHFFKKPIDVLSLIAILEEKI